MASEDNDTDAEYETWRKRKCIKGSVWDHYEVLNDGTAKCNLCYKILSCRTSITNLKQHLCRRHPEIALKDKEVVTTHHLYSTALNSRKSPRYFRHDLNTVRKFLSYLKENDTLANTTNEYEDITMKFSSEISGYFEENDEEAKCKMCKAFLPRNLDDMKNHLEEQHGSIYGDIINNTQTQETNSEDDVTRTEILYLEEPENTLDYTPRKRKIKKEPTETHKLRKVRETSTSPPNVPTPKTEEPVVDDLEVFLNYIRLLLRKVPKEAAQKLHLDMITMIMNTQT